MVDVKSIDDLRDSRLLYEKKLPVFGYILLLLIAALMVCILIWSLRTQKVDVVHAQGNVQSVNKNYVMAPFGGEIREIWIAEGDLVSKDDPLFTIKSTELEMQDKQLSEQRLVYEKQIAQNTKFIEAVKGDQNLFNAADPGDNLFYSQFELYKSQVAEQTVDTDSMKAYGYSDAQIDAEVGKNQARIAGLYYSNIKQAEDQIAQAQMQLDFLDAQLDAVDFGKENYKMVAPESGRIHMMGDYRDGMVVQAGSAIASIAAEGDEYRIYAVISANDYPRIEVDDAVSILPSGLAQTVYGTITGKVTRIDSDITIPQDSSGNAQPYFRVEVLPDVNYVLSKNGHKVNLTNGMAVEVRVEYDEVRYVDYFLESLGLLTRD